MWFEEHLECSGTQSLQLSKFISIFYRKLVSRVKRMRIELDEKDEGQRREKMKMDTEASEENFYVNIN